MQAMFACNLKRLSVVYAVLRANPFAFSASNAFFGYFVALEFGFAVSDNIVFSENRIYAEIKIFDFRVLDLKNNTDISCVIRVNVGKIRLLGEDGINAGVLPLVRHGNGFRGNPYHFLESCVSQNLHSAVRKKLAAEILSSCGEEIKALVIKMNCADTAYLRSAAAVNCSE